MQQNLPSSLLEDIFAHIRHEDTEKELKLADGLAFLKLILFTHGILLRIILTDIILDTLGKFIE